MKMKVVRLFYVILGLILLGIMITAVLAEKVTPHPYFKEVEVLVMAHRGGRDLWPENTLYAFEGAVALGVDVLEMDLHSTKDGVIVVMHDKTVDRTTDGEGPIQDFTWDELRLLDAGYHWSEDDGQTFPYRGQGITIPTLEQVLSSFPDMRLNIEIKQSEPSIVDAVCELILDYQMQDMVLVASFNTDTIQEFRQACSEVASTAGEGEVRLLYVLSLLYLGRLYSPPAEAVQVPEYRGNIHVLTPRFVSAAHNRGMQVHVWTVNQADDMERFIEMDVDGIITDRPDLLFDVLDR
jgi:glycerophosphoryl diester phosphodiesterase